jgi:hypothetical protein
MTNQCNSPPLNGNTCWWRVQFAAANAAFVCDKTKLAGDAQKRDQWFGVSAFRSVLAMSWETESLTISWESGSIGRG